jgi:hypothetical protein
MKMALFCVVALCSLVKVYQRFRGVFSQPSSMNNLIRKDTDGSIRGPIRGRVVSHHLPGVTE